MASAIYWCVMATEKTASASLEISLLPEGLIVASCEARFSGRAHLLHPLVRAAAIGPLQKSPPRLTRLWRPTLSDAPSGYPLARDTVIPRAATLLWLSQQEGYKSGLIASHSGAGQGLAYRGTGSFSSDDCRAAARYVVRRRRRLDTPDNGCVAIRCHLQRRRGGFTSDHVGTNLR